MTYVSSAISADVEAAEVGHVDWSDQMKMMNDDRQKQLFDLATRLDDEVAEAHVMSTLAQLSDYVRSHCHEEETLMAKSDYPGTKALRRLHQEFRNMLSDLIGRARRMTLDEIAKEIKYLINGWLYCHSMVVDIR